MGEFDREEHKEIIKEAIREWLDEKYATFGKWTFHGLTAAGLAYGAYFLLGHGWIR